MSVQLAPNTSAPPSGTIHRVLAAFAFVFGAAVLWSWIHASPADAAPATSVIDQPAAPLPVAVAPVAVPPATALPVAAPAPGDITLPADVADTPVGAPSDPAAPQLGPALPELGPAPDGVVVVDPPEATAPPLPLPSAPSSTQSPSRVVPLAPLSTPTPAVVVVPLSEGAATSAEPRPTAPLQLLSPSEPVAASRGVGDAAISSEVSETGQQLPRSSPLSWVAAANTSRRDFRRPADDALPTPSRGRPQNQRLPGSVASLLAVGDVGVGTLAILLATFVMPAPAFGERSPPSPARRRARGFLQPLERPG